MVAFMCVIVTYPEVTAPERRHPSPARPPRASFCLTDSLRLRLFVLLSKSLSLVMEPRGGYSYMRRGRVAARQTDGPGWLAMRSLIHAEACHIGYHTDMRLIAAPFPHNNEARRSFVSVSISGFIV